MIQALRLPQPLLRMLAASIVVSACSSAEAAPMSKTQAETYCSGGAGTTVGKQIAEANQVVMARMGASGDIKQQLDNFFDEVGPKITVTNTTFDETTARCTVNFGLPKWDIDVTARVDLQKDEVSWSYKQTPEVTQGIKMKVFDWNKDSILRAAGQRSMNSDAWYQYKKSILGIK